MEKVDLKGTTPHSRLTSIPMSNVLEAQPVGVAGVAGSLLAGAEAYAHNSKARPETTANPVLIHPPDPVAAAETQLPSALLGSEFTCWANLITLDSEVKPKLLLYCLKSIIVPSTFSRILQKGVKGMSMRRPLFPRIPIRFFLFAVLALGPVHGRADIPQPPPTRRDDVRDVVHGVEITDPYRWLEDQESPETRAWIDAQNAYTQSVLGQAGGRDSIRDGLARFIRYDSYTTPVAGGGYYFFMRELADDNLASLCLRQGLHGEDEVLLDPLHLSDDMSITVKIMKVSDDGAVLAYGLRVGGEDEVAVRFYDVEGRRDLADELPRGRYDDISFEPGNGGIYYSRFLDEGPRVYRHVMGSDPAADRMVFGTAYGPGTGISAELSDDGRFLVMTVWHGSSGDKTEIYVKDLEAGGDAMAVVNDIDARFYGSIGGHDLYMFTNWEAPNGRVIKVDLENPSRDAWEEIIPESNLVLKYHAVAGGMVFANYLENVVSSVKIFDPSGRPSGGIDFPTLGTVSKMSGRWRDDTAFFSFKSYHVPPTLYHYSVAKGTRGVWYEADVPFESDDYETRQVWYTSRDGTKVPMFLVHRKDLDPDGDLPVLLTGYGGFTHTVNPRFSSGTAMWIMNGGVYAAPSLRGGGEFGEEWHRAGMLESKQNTFDDFIAAAEWLVDNGYTRPGRIAIWGGSNGGLLVGAALTQRPDLFRAVVCTYPLLDMVRYHKFLVAAWWVPEYGSSDDPEQFEYLYAYSPYHRVVMGTAYPAVLFVTGDADTRVAPLHARKMAALLQAATSSKNPVLLQYDTRAGHSGGKPTDKYIEDATDRLQFLFWQLGIGLENR
jgi:prolyl oligopeptidase